MNTDEVLRQTLLNRLETLRNAVKAAQLTLDGPARDLYHVIKRSNMRRTIDTCNAHIKRLEGKL